MIHFNAVFMKTPFLYILLLLLLVGCKSDNKLTFEPIDFQGDTCEGCPQVTITLPKALESGKIAKTINTALSEEIISLLNFEDETEPSNIKEAISSFTKGYLDLKKMYPDETMQWEAKINGEVTFEDEKMITIQLSSYLFTGGAHGYGSTLFLNFDKTKGTELEDWELFASKEDFQSYAETKFRLQEAIPKDQSINSTGFMFEQDSFYLPENIGFTKDGLKLLYNQYEVASYADGPVELTLPYKEVQKFLAKKIKS